MQKKRTFAIEKMNVRGLQVPHFSLYMLYHKTKTGT